MRIMQAVCEGGTPCYVAAMNKNTLSIDLSTTVLADRSTEVHWSCCIFAVARWASDGVKQAVTPFRHICNTKRPQRSPRSSQPQVGGTV